MELTEEEWAEREEFCNNLAGLTMINEVHYPLPIPRIVQKPNSLEELLARRPEHNQAGNRETGAGGDESVNQFAPPSLNEVKRNLLRYFAPPRLDRSRGRAGGTTMPILRRPLGKPGF